MAAPNNHRNGFARKNGRRPVETGACRAPRGHRHAQWKLVRAERRESIVCDVYPDEKQEAMLEPLAKFQERFDRAFFRALRELEKLQKIRRQTAPPPVNEAPPAFTEPQPSGSGTPPEPGYPLGPPQPPSDAPDLAYTMSAEPPTPAQPDSVTFPANGGIDT